MDDNELEDRRRKLNAALSAHEAAETEAKAKSSRPGEFAGYAAAFRMSTEFVSAIFVGVVLGYGLDWIFGTLPLFLAIFLLLGFAAGVLNVLRSAGLIHTPQVGKRPPNDGGGPFDPPGS